MEKETKKQQVKEKLLDLIDKREQAIDIAVINKSFLDRLLKRDVRRFYVHDMTLNEVEKFFLAFDDIDFKEFVDLVNKNASEAEFLQYAKEFITKYKYNIINALAVFLNTKDVLWLERNLTVVEILKLLSFAFEKLNLDDFFGSLGLLAAAQGKLKTTKD
jgi:hypothetical protein